jgi:hypothetical protein
MPSAPPQGSCRPPASGRRHTLYPIRLPDLTESPVILFNFPLFSLSLPPGDLAAGLQATGRRRLTPHADAEDAGQAPTTTNSDTSSRATGARSLPPLHLRRSEKGAGPSAAHGARGPLRTTLFFLPASLPSIATSPFLHRRPPHLPPSGTSPPPSPSPSADLSPLRRRSSHPPPRSLPCLAGLPQPQASVLFPPAVDVLIIDGVRERET